MDLIHGGALMSWIDCMTSIAIFGFDKKRRMFAITVNMSIDCASIGKINEDFLIKADVLHVGKHFAFAECKHLDPNGRLIASGTHKMAFLN